MTGPSRDTLAAMFEHVRMFSATVFAVHGDFDVDPGIYCGSGTFVYGQGASYLLTAAHVWDDGVSVGRPERFGLHLRPERKGISIPTSVKVDRIRGDGPDGPDIALVSLPEIDARAIAARGKIFYNLDKRRVAQPAQDSLPSLWAIFGAPGEQAAKDDVERQWEMPTGLYGHSETPAGSERDGFDYAELRTLHDGRDGRPRSYGGLSGSGLWRFRHDATSGQWDPKGELAGVAFYEVYQPGTGEGIVRCHGRNSIFTILDRSVGGLEADEGGDSR
jgi:hypothetical protein